MSYDVKAEAAKIARMCGAWPDGTYAEIIAEALEDARKAGATEMRARASLAASRSASMWADTRSAVAGEIAAVIAALPLREEP